MIVDSEPLTSTFVSVPSDFGQLSVDAYMSGIIDGVLSGAGFSAIVTAQSFKLEDGETNPNATSNNNGSVPTRREQAVFLVKFSNDLMPQWKGDRLVQQLINE